MAFTKFASLENAEVLEVKGSNFPIRTASLDKLSNFEDYRTEDGFLYARIRAISSRVNKNHDGWPSIELAGGQDAFDRFAGTRTAGFVVEADSNAKYGYSTFLGKPIFVDHHNSDPSKARGVIVDAKLHVDDHRTASEHDSYYESAPENHTPPTWVELLLEVDAQSFPRLAAALVEGSNDPTKGIDGFSMGCDVERSVCNICKNAATTPDEYCEHVQFKGAEFPYTDPLTGRTSSRKSYEDCYGIKFFEISAVFDPADETALLREIRAHTAAENYEYSPEELENARRIWERGFAIDQDGQPMPSGDIACMECGGQGCPACHGTGQGNPYSVQNPGGDGVMTPQYLKPNQQGFGPPLEEGSALDGYPRRQGSIRTAEAPPPQVDELKMPEPVDTLREETICPVCGSDMDEETCDVCGYTRPPEGFDNPDLSKAGELQDQEQPNPEQGDKPQAPPDETFGPDIPEGNATSNPQTFAHVNGDMPWNVSTPHQAYTNPSKETPVAPNTGPSTDEPKDAVVLKDHDKPVTSNVRTAQDFLDAAAGAQRRPMPEKTAEAASGAPEAATPDKNVDTVGVGGVIEPTNEEASKADAQIDVEGVGNTGVSDVAADSTESVDQGSETSKNIEAIPTKTFDNGSSAVERQADPVGSEAYPSSGGVTSAWAVTALDAEPYPSEDGGLAGGSANEGTEPADAVGKADERVDVLDAVTTPANNSGDTKTWSGTDGNAVTRQQEPVTQDTLEGSDIVNLSPKGSGHIFAAFKLADQEVSLGLIASDRKYDRVAELENLSPEALQAEARVVSRVKTAGLSKATKTVQRMPTLGRNSSVEKEAGEGSGSETVQDYQLFL